MSSARLRPADRGGLARTTEEDRSLGPTEAPVDSLLRRLRPEITKILTRQAIPGSDAEDLLQEALVALVYKWDAVRNPEAWLLATLQSRCAIYWRRRREDPLDAVDVASLDALAGPQAPAQRAAELRHDLNAAFCRLSEPHRSLLQLRFGLGCESAEIAAALGFGSESVRTLTNESLSSLTRELKILGLTRDNVRS